MVNTPANAPSAADLWMVGADGAGRVKLTSAETIDLMPVWGANDRIYFVSNRSGTDNIWSLDAADAVLAASGQAPGSTFAGVEDND